MDLNVILFDLDGTLLPMDQDLFVKDYFGRLAKKLIPYGYEPEALTKAIWTGTGAMIQNDGKLMNEEVFWKVFSGICGEQVKEHLPVFDEYYRNDFQKVKVSCGFHPMAKEVVHTFKTIGYRVALATNPLFPRIATESRIRWAGLEPEDFELFTTYESSRYCKPNLDYYREVMGKLDVQPQECLMVGNDVGEDMIVRELGMDVFLLTDCLINKANIDISQYPNGSFEELITYVKAKRE